MEGAKAELGPGAARLIAGRGAYALTIRELAVLELLARGMSNRQIADALCISVPTANSHVAKILRKMGATSRTEAATRAIKEALLT